MTTKEETPGKISFRTHPSYFPEEILAAGGTTVFGRKMEKNNASLIEALEKAPAVEPFTDEEWDLLQQQLHNKINK
jgi:hypothetical protein